METMSYPSSPFIPFLPTHHEESSYSYLLWSHQVAIAGPETGNMCAAHPIPSPDEQQDDNELIDMLFREASYLLQDDLSNGGDPFASLDGCLCLAGQENVSMVATVQEEPVEGDSLGNLLVACAMAVEARDSTTASAILSRVDSLLTHGVSHRSYHHAAVDSASDILAGYFARGLHSRMSSGARRTAAAPALPENRMPAYWALQELSPFIKFAHFTANQAILEAAAADNGPDLHVVDLNIGEGVQWASLMADLARTGGKSTFRLTAVITDPDAGRGCMAARWLSEFAESLNLPFRYSSLHLRDEEDLHSFAAESCNDSPVIISCDTTDCSYSSVIKLQTLLLRSVKILQPKLVVLIEDELLRIGRTNQSTPGLALGSFAEFFRDALHHFAAVLDSLASGFCDGGYGACLDLVEREMLGLRIEDAVARYQAAAMTGDMQGLRPCDLSSFNVAQAKMLVGLFSRGFGVVHEEAGRLALCWNSRPLTSVSVWSRPVL